MNIDKFLQPRKDSGDTVNVEVVFYDRELGEDVNFDGEFVKTSSRKFKQLIVDVSRKKAAEDIKEDEYGDTLLSEMMVSANLNGEPLDKTKMMLLLARYPELGDYIDREASKQLVFIKPHSGGSQPTQKESGGSKSRSVRARKQRGSPTTGK